VVLTLGYGRREVGRIANGVGFDAYSLRSSEAPDFDAGTVVKASGTALLAATQEHGSMEGRQLIREATLDEYKHEPAFAQEAVEVPKLESMWAEKPYSAGHQWGMTIDLNSCVGATPASSPARARTTSRSSARIRCAAGGRCTGSASTGTSPASPSSRG
jgi:molybdopterin-containing oxidoreductase family iron-sulfur binding subunit